MNVMKNIRIEKLTINMGTGTNQDQMKKGQKLIQALTGIAPVKTVTQKRIPGWNLRPGLPIGLKLTLRKDAAVSVLKRVLVARENKLKRSCFDSEGNVSFGVTEYIDIPGLAYDPEIGILGFQITATLERPGFRTKRRKLQTRKVGKEHKISQQDSVEYFQKEFNVKVDEE